MGVTIEEWPLSNGQLLHHVWAPATADAPYCYDVDAEAFGRGLTAAIGDESWVTDRSEKLLVALSGATPAGFAHLCADRVSLDNRKVDCGIIRFLAFAPDAPAVGQALLNRAEAVVSAEGLHHIDAFSAFHGYPFHDHTRGFLPDRLTHITSLLVDNGYRPHDAHLTLVRDTEAPTIDATPDLEVRIEKEFGGGVDAEIKLYAFHGDERIGMCRFYSSRRYVDLPTLEPFAYIRFIGINEAYRGRGIGRFLLNHTLDEMRNAGYKRTVLNCRERNTAAVSLYHTSGYRTDDTARAYDKALIDKNGPPRAPRAPRNPGEGGLPRYST